MKSENDPLRLIPTKHAPEARADIGTGLKAARARKGYSIEAVTQHTRIPRKFLEALEANRFEEFPALAYLRGFLKTYCDYLEVDFEAVWKQVLPEPAAADPAAAAAVKAVPAPAAKPAARAPASDAPASTHKAAPQAAKPAKPQTRLGHPEESEGPKISSWAVIAVALGLGLVLWLALGRGADGPPAPAEPVAPAALQPLGGPREPLLGISARGDAWISVVVDGTLRYEGRVPLNSKQEWKMRRAVVLRTSDPGALELTIDGAATGLPKPDASGAYRIEP